MITLKDLLHDLIDDSIEAHETCYRNIKDPDDAEREWADINEDNINEFIANIKNSLG